MSKRLSIRERKALELAKQLAPPLQIEGVPPREQPDAVASAPIPTLQVASPHPNISMPLINQFEEQRNMPSTGHPEVQPEEINEPPSSRELVLSLQAAPKPTDNRLDSRKRKSVASEAAEGADEEKKRQKREEKKKRDEERKREEEKKKRESARAGIEVGLGAITDDDVAAATLFARVTEPRSKLPPPRAMKEVKLYRKMSLRGTKFLSSINETIAAYDAEANRHERLIGELKESVTDAKAKYEDARVKMEAEKARADNACAEAAKTKAEAVTLSDAMRRSVERANQLNAEVASLKRQLAAKEEAHKIEMIKAEKAARRDVKGKMQARLDKAEATIAELEAAKASELDLAQVVANIELIDLLRGENPPTLEAEKEKLLEWKAEVAGAGEEFVRVATCLRDELKVSPESDVSIHQTFGGESVEALAGTLGVENPAGSNDGLVGNGGGSVPVV